MRYGVLIVLIGILLNANVVFADEDTSYGELAGYVALDNRVFLHSPTNSRQEMNSGPSFVIEPEYYYQWNDDKDTITVQPFARFDPFDGERSHLDIRQMDILHAADDWEIRAGASKVFWGVTESNHLVDIINQTDAVEDVDGEDKLGQPMIQAAIFKKWGSLRLYYLPYFRERTFNGVKGRPRGAIPIETDSASYESSAEEWHQDVAVRYSHVLGYFDVGVSHFSGTSREPRFVTNLNADGENVLIPFYDVIDQTGIDVQFTKDAWLLKLEAISRSGQDERFFATTAGLEYSFYGIFESAYDLGFLLEYHRDDRGELAPLTFFDDDVFFGLRLVANDVYDSDILGGVVIDRNTHARFYSIEANRRINDDWKAELDLRLFGHINTTLPEAGLRQDDHFQLRLGRYL